MTTTGRMVVIYRTPRDPAAFDAHYFNVHIPLARKLPGLRSYEVSKRPIATPAGDAEPYLIGHAALRQSRRAAPGIRYARRACLRGRSADPRAE